MTWEKLLLLASKAPDQQAGQAAKRRWDSIAKPLGSLGLLEQSVEKIAALTGQPDYSIGSRAVLVFCADNGVVEEGVTQTGSGVTASVARNLAAGTTAVCVMAGEAHCRVIPVDVGILNMPSVPGLLRRRAANGTGNIARGPAMTREEAKAAVLAGANLVEEQMALGVKIFAVGEMGIGNTTTASALSCALLGETPERMTGRGAGLSAQGLAKKVDAVRRALAVNRDAFQDPLGTLAAVGGLDIAAMAGAFLGGAALGAPMIVDGVISAAAALAAARLAPGAEKAMIAGHVSAEPAGALLLHALCLEPLITARMRLGEGTEAVAALPLLDMAYAVYRLGGTFEQAEIEAYRPL